MDDPLIRNVVKVATLGEGSQGTVWSARIKGSTSRKRGKGAAAAPYALKQRLIKRGDAMMRDTKSSSALREIEFYRKVANRNPTVFSQLFDWEITEATQEVKDSFNTEVGGTTRAGRTSLKQYTHLLTTLSARKEGVLRSVYRSLNKAQWLSMLAQVCHGIGLIHDRGFSHGDVWEANVAFVRVPWSRDVPIYRSSVPSMGYVWSIIDYGSVELHRDESLQEKNKRRASSYELDDMVSLASGEDDAEEDCGSESADILSDEFRRHVLNSLDGPSVRLGMKRLGLPLHQVLALINLDSYLWHVCGHSRSSTVKQWIDRTALLRLADMNASYSQLAHYFAKQARDLVKSQ